MLTADMGSKPAARIRPAGLQIIRAILTFQSRPTLAAAPGVVELRRTPFIARKHPATFGVEASM
ncbi:hypothetical protein ACTJI5_17135 [Sphingopyxis sp. 22461]